MSKRALNSKRVQARAPATLLGPGASWENLRAARPDFGRPEAVGAAQREPAGARRATHERLTERLYHAMEKHNAIFLACAKVILARLKR